MTLVPINSFNVLGSACVVCKETKLDTYADSGAHLGIGDI